MACWNVLDTILIQHCQNFHKKAYAKLLHKSLKGLRVMGLGFFGGGRRGEKACLKKEERWREDHEAEPGFTGAVGEGIGRPFPITVIILCH